MLKIIVFFLSVYIVDISGHGMMLQPVGRQSRWRYDSTAPPDYNDNELFCGGIGPLWNVNKGKCGLCGNDYSLPTPRPHELGGLYGSGVIVGKYAPGQQIPVTIKLSANHKGYFYFDLCNIDQQRESEECFANNPIYIADGSSRYNLPSYQPDSFQFHIRIPSNLRCRHCVLRWTYQTANNWGTCENGTQGAGCGPQEVFKNCADISVL